MPVLHDELQIEHVAIGHIVTPQDMPATRYDGDTLVVPIVEEVLVVEKRMLLKEEVRITKKQREQYASQTVVLRSVQVAIERFDEQHSPPSRNKVPDASS